MFIKMATWDQHPRGWVLASAAMSVEALDYPLLVKRILINIMIIIPDQVIQCYGYTIYKH